MKRYGVLVLWGILILSEGGCKRRSCEGVECLNGGTCRNGRCNCPVGFGGGYCQEKWSDAWIGNYTVDDRCRVVGLIPQYEASLSASPLYPDVIYLEGFGDIRCEGQRLRVEARLTAPNVAEINRQSSCNRRYIIEGRIERDANRRTLIVNYFYQDLQTNLADTCRAEWFRY
ncbi:MAG: calcium-binding EGF-like domain-containing protein [Bacteroidia bacterium]|nr:calcium-binding EGF-like domain-containing protein [Bacteroidia bacterium]MDW8014958.1 calcium-binding EGF-like domain-containing protein [Bacteroidia bacterium]